MIQSIVSNEVAMTLDDVHLGYLTCSNASRISNIFVYVPTHTTVILQVIASVNLHGLRYSFRDLLEITVSDI